MPADDDTPPLSEVLRTVADGDDDRICMDDLMARFGGSAMGALLLLFSLACLLPLPPGSTTIFGLPLLLLAPQLTLGRKAPWMPSQLRRRSVSRHDLRKGLPRLVKWLRRLESLSRPRLDFLFSPLGVRALGAVCALLAFVLILPIPLGNFLPAIAVSLLSLSLVQRDGYLAIAGYVMTLVSLAVLVVTFGALMRLARHLITVLWGA